MWHALAVGTGGFCGAILRWSISTAFAHRMPAYAPFATLIVNVIGCSCIGVLAGYIHHNAGMPDFWRLLLVTGLLGSLTTFSTFGLETVLLAQEGRFRMCSAYLIGNLVLGILAVLSGLWIAERLWSAS